jgi:NAD(P)-dependent dehydrogenase (short-subunit alcohol dehydrogenase family)
MVAGKGMPSNSAYAATKAAIRSFARGWLIDLKDRHIRVNVISPGPLKHAASRVAPQTNRQPRRCTRTLRNWFRLGVSGNPMK